MNCNKVFFSDEKQAKYYLDKLKKTSIRGRVPFRSYLCEKCFNWHLTAEHDKTYLLLKQRIDSLLNKNENLKKIINIQEIKIKKLESIVNEYKQV